jgi:two-component system sensor histidine kinase BaeS
MEPLISGSMKLNIFTKLFFSLLSTTVVVVIAMAVSVHWSFRRGFAEYYQQVEVERLDSLVSLLEREYQENGDWNLLRHNHRRWHNLLREDIRGERPAAVRPPGDRDARFIHPRPPGFERAPPAFEPPYPPFPEYSAEREQPVDLGPLRFSRGPPGPFRRPPPPDPLLLGRRLRLLDAQKHPVIGRPDTPPEETLRPITHGAETVGWLGIRPSEIKTDRLALSFINQQRQTYSLIAVLAAGLSVLASLLLARQLLVPVRRIAAGAKSLAAGRYDTQVQVSARDELGQLAADFNLLARTLQRNEVVRRQWIADISHELRTPLAILRGEIEALQDGIREPTQARIQSLHTEVLALNKLVNDLYELSLSDLGAMDYRKAPLNLLDILADVVTSFSSRFAHKGIELQSLVDNQGPIPVFGDARRLAQLFSNLAENSWRYTDSGGSSEISVHKNTHKVIVDFQDSTPGVPDEALAHLCERLYRVDKSRSRALGGAGLGLAICKNIVEAHDGTLRASHSSSGGLLVRVELPLAPT